MPPTFLFDSLNAVRRKAKTLSVTFGIGIALASAIGLVLGSVAIDFLFSYLLNINLAGGLRLLLLLAIVAAVVYASIRLVIKPLVSRISLSDVAGHLESVFPQFDDRLRSTVNFADGSVPGSDYMKKQTIAQATEMVQKVDLSRALITRPVWYSVSSAVLATGIFIAISLILPDFISRGLPRLFQPFGGDRWAKKVEIDAAALPMRVPVGQRIDVSMALKKGDNTSRKALIYYQYDNGPIQKEYMIRGETGRYTASLDARGENLKVWMASEDDETAKQVIQVVPRLAIQRVEAIVTPPAYAQMPPITQNLAAAPAYMVNNSQVSLQIGFNKELDTTQPVVLTQIVNEGALVDGQPVKPAPAPELTWNLSNPRIAIATFTAKDNFRFRIAAKDKDTFNNNGLEEYEIIVKPDQLPTVQIESPKKNVERTPDAYLPLQILAEDDFGIATMRLIVDRIGAAPAPDAQKDTPAAAAATAHKHWEIDLKNWQKIDGDGQRQRFRLNWDWELKETLGDLRPGDVLEYAVEVKDNFRFEAPGAPVQVHPAQFSSRLRVTIISQEQATIAATEDVRTLGQQVKSVHANQVTNQTETKQLKQDTEKKPEMSKADKAQAEALAARQSTIINNVKTISNRVEDVQKFLKENRIQDKDLNEISQQSKEQLDQAAEKPMTDAVNDLNKAAQSKSNPSNPEQQKQAQQARSQSLDKADDNQQKAADKLQKAMEQMDRVGNLPKMIKDIQELLDNQIKLKNELKELGKEILGKPREQLTDEQKKKLDQNARDQKAAAEKTDNAVKQMEKMGEQMKKSDPQSAQAMKEAAQQAKSQQISQQQQSAAQQAQQNQQAGAQQAQQQAQLGLEVVLNTLKDAERRKLEQLAKALDEAIAAIKELVRRQAGHNLDNLDLQGGDAKVKAMTKEELEVLYAKAQRDQKNPPPAPQPGVLTSGQEQTERNTRATAKAIEEVPVGAAAAADLVRAAGKMGYAIVDLRDKKLAAAYNPHQVEALAALEAGLKKAEEEKAKVEKQQQDAQKEAIKAQFEKIRAEQLSDVNKPTADVEALRLADKTLPREAGVRIKQVIPRQDDLAKRVRVLKEELAKLEGTVYPWAAGQVAEAMDEVKEDLAKQKTGKSVQLTEARIIDELDAMIKSLKQEKNQSAFVQKPGGGGGGGGGGGSKLPTEAELRLMKALQESINKNTTEADKLPKEEQDKVALVNLGNRQGQIRSLLDTLLKKVTQGKEGLKPEPKQEDKLPEEAGKEQIENQEADAELLGGDPKAAAESKQLNRVGDRMARSRQRLALDNDPGKVTQEIQKRIVVDLDDMIKQAQQQQASNSQPGKGKGQGPPKPGDGQGQGQQQANGQKPGGQSKPNNGSSPAGQSTVSQGGSTAADTSSIIKETNREWGSISPRLRDAVIEGAGEQVIEKYRKLVEDYYRGVSTGGKQ